MNACLNLVKAFLAPKVRNNPDWMPRFLVLKASTFSARIYFLDFLYNFFVLALFYLNLLSGFPYHRVLDFRFLPPLRVLRLRLSLA